MTRLFRFKQFSVHHDQCAMKVGTDGILLGAWAGNDLPESQRPQSVIDIGAGSGLIALMLAQRFSNSEITGIELCAKAAQQARENFKRSPWHNRLSLIEADARSYRSSSHHDFVVANPPFFSDSLQPPNTSRAVARHADSLTFSNLVNFATDSLSETGRLAVVVPFQRADRFCDEAQQADLKLTRRCDVQPTHQKPFVRSLLQFERINNEVDSPSLHENLVLELTRHEYSEEFRRLTREFYLKH